MDHRCTMGTFTLWRTWRSHDKVKGHLRSNYPFVRPLKFWLTFFKLLLFEQVRFNYVQTWIIGALWEPSHYDALGGHTTRSKVIGGQIVIVIFVNLFLILFEQVRFNYKQTWIIYRYNKGAQWEPSRYDAFRGHMTRSKVIGGQIVIVMIALFQIFS